MPRESIRRGRAGAAAVEVCEHCGQTPPWHSLSCPKVAGRYCLECEMLLPRHYPGCTQDVIGFGNWATSRRAQRELQEMYNIEREAAVAEGKAVTAHPAPQPTWFVGKDQMLRPRDSLRLRQAIMEMMQMPTREKKEVARKAIHAEIERLAGGGE